MAKVNLEPAKQPKKLNVFEQITAKPSFGRQISRHVADRFAKSGSLSLQVLREIKAGIEQASAARMFRSTRSLRAIVRRDALDRRLVPACSEMRASEGQAGVREVSRLSVGAHRNMS